MIFKMPSVSVLLFLFSFINVGLLQGTGSGTNGNLRLCIVEGRGSYKRAPKFCPILDIESSGVECVIGTDRLDCLRRISKGTVDFGVFSPEDLVAAQWAVIDVLVTNELRHRDRPFERSVVAVVNRRILPEGSSTLHAILKNSTLCHPGVGAEDIRPLSDTLSGYLESLVLERSCEPGLSHTENRIKALAGYFGKACKAGPWVVDVPIDTQLKRKYPSLCAACSSPSKCSNTDRYWGDSGALTCLGDGAGDVTWAEYDDVSTYFGVKKANSTVSGNFVFLCRDGTWRTLDEEPCVWLHRPWNVIVAKRKAAAAVSSLAQSLTAADVTVDQHWRGALARLLETTTALRDPLTPTPPPGDYLAKAKGFREAYSQSGCDPPRHITFCTTSLLEKNKCDWLSEAGAVYGISPPLQCVVREGVEECVRAVGSGDSDVTVAGSDWLVRGKRDYSIVPILHELTPILEKTNAIVAYVRKDSKISKMADLRGKRAAFPRFDGMSWHSVMTYMEDKEKVGCKEFVTDYFVEICAPGAEGKVASPIVKNCYEEGDDGALRSLLDGATDVAFVSMTTYNKFTAEAMLHPGLKDIVPLCPDEMKMYCFLSWSSIGHVFTSKNVTEVRRQEIVNVFGKLDKMFGKHPPFHTAMFSMYGPFNHELDVLFHNNTRVLAQNYSLLHPYDKIPLNYEKRVSLQNDFSCSFGGKIAPSLLIIAVALVSVIFSF